ncbi:MAG: hypothetical protein U0271_01640 [Polyangiaceae bacterium]
MYNAFYCELSCPVCKRSALQEVQFKYGNLRRHEYREGDTLVWGEPAVGDARYHDVLVLGITDCTSCGETYWCNLRVLDSTIGFHSIFEGSPEYPNEEFVVCDPGGAG